VGASLKDRYQIEEELGRGGMAVVYRARDAILQRDVAVKVLHSHLADRKVARQRLRREAVAVAKLSQDNILKVYDFSEENENGPAFLVTEYVRGTTLREFFDEHKELPCEVAVMMGVVLCEALSHAHKAGIIHRDIKPENVMYRTEDGALKLMDFGIAKLFEEKELTLTGGLLGSPAHMAPEVIEGKNADARSDLFSLGTMIYLFATGDYPFWANNPHALLRQIAQGKCKDPEVVRAAVGRRLSGIIKKSMALDPANRYPDADAMAKELRVFLEDLGIDDPYKALAAIFRNVEEESKKLQDKVVAVLLVRAREALKLGRKGEVLAHVNRVLGYEPENQEAQALVDSLHKSNRWWYVAGASGGALALGLFSWGVYWLIQTTETPKPTTLNMVPYAWKISAPSEPTSNATQPVTQETIQNNPETKPTSQVTTAPATMVANPPKTTPVKVNPVTFPTVEEQRVFSVRFSLSPYGTLKIDGDSKGTIYASGESFMLAAREKPYRVLFDHTNYAAKECDLYVGVGKGGPTLKMCGAPYTDFLSYDFKEAKRFKPAKVNVSVSPASEEDVTCTYSGGPCGRFNGTKGTFEFQMNSPTQLIEINLLRGGKSVDQKVTVTAGDNNPPLAFEFGGGK
jgi:serine/threonine protein kinase